MIEEINLEEGMPSAEAALDNLKISLEVFKARKLKVLVVIHGYGSTGKGGAIRLKTRQWLNAKQKNGYIHGVINGEDFDIFNNRARILKDKHKELNEYIGAGNNGITIIEI